LNGQICDGEGGNRRLQTVSCRQPSDLSTQLAAVIGDQPSVDPAVGLGARPAIERHPTVGVADQEPGRGEARRVHRPDTEKLQPQLCHRL
jgi:hypothetical protein